MTWIVMAVEFLALPIVFGYLLFLRIHRSVIILPLDVAIACVAVLPILLRLVKKYVKELKVGPDGLSVTMETGDISPIQPKELVLTNEAPNPLPLKADSDFNGLGSAAKKLLTTLWVNQKSTHGENSATRWGFRLHLYDGVEFNIGFAQLHEKGYVGITQERGLVYLQDSGMSFCKKYSSEIAAYPQMWRRPGQRD